MKRIFGVVFALGLVGGAAGAQELELKPPELTARSTCPPSLQARCAGIAPRGLMDHDVGCEQCAGDVMPADIASSPRQVSTPAKTDRPLQCAMSLMPLGVTAPGCLRLPVDNIPQP